MKLQIEHLNYSIETKQILDDIQMAIPSKQFVGIIGPNGSGKTTLLRNIYRVASPESGVILLDGININEISQRETAKKMAVLRQESDTEFDYSVKEIVAMGRFPHHKLLDPDTKEDEDIVEECLARVGMTAKKDRMISNLSGGEKQRVLIARALAQKADFLVLDEPTNHLDIFYKLQIMELVKNLGITVISAIHDIDLACKYCDYIYVLKHGHIVAHGAPEQVITPELIRTVFHVYAEVHTDQGNHSIQVRYIRPAATFEETDDCCRDFNKI